MKWFIIDCFISGINYEMIDLNGSCTILVNGYTFSKGGTAKYNFYLCSKNRRLRCKARLNFNKHWEVTSCLLEHNHEPPKLQKLKNGTYMKL